MKMSTIYLIRHGQASFGSENYDKLSDLGCRQAMLLGEYLSNNNIYFGAAYTGSLQRQQKTASLVLEHQPNAISLQTESRFNEILLDDLIATLLPKLAESNKVLKELIESGFSSSKQFQKVVKATFNYWVSDQCPDVGVQTWKQFSDNVVSALKFVQEQQGAGKTIAIFTSGGTIATLVAYVLGLNGSQTYQFFEPVINCSITQILYNKQHSSLSCFNDFSYLNAQNTTSENLITYR